MDAFYKIAYFEHELKFLKDAKAADPEGGRIDSMSDMQLKREASRKVRATSQSSSETPKIIEALLNKSSFALWFAPFIRFKADVFRIMVNTPKIAMEEIRSGNSVLRKRGIQRMSGFALTAGAATALAPYLISKLVGVGDEEDNAFRAGIVDYLKGHQFVYVKGLSGKLETWDFTYVNPFSMYVDPVTLSVRDALRGDYSDSIGKLVKGYVSELVLDEQILAGAVSQALANYNAKDGKPIYEKRSDSAWEAGMKMLTYVSDGAFKPGVLKSVLDAHEAAGASVEEAQGRSFQETPAGILTSMFYPMKPYIVDPEKSLRSYIFSASSEMNNVKNRMNKVFTDKPMSEKTIRNLYVDNVEDRAAIESDIFQKIQGFKGAGMSESDIRRTLAAAKLGKRRINNLMRGVMDRPLPNPQWVHKLSETKHGTVRAGVIFRTATDFDQTIDISVK